MSILEIWILISIIWSAIGACVLLGMWLNMDYVRYSNGLQFLNPIYIYQQIRVNWFGAFWVMIFFNAICPIISFSYWFYKLCTVGRKTASVCEGNGVEH